MSESQREIDDHNRRTVQLETNAAWLRQKIDQIAEILCPDFLGTWQQTAEQAVKSARELKEQMNAPLNQFADRLIANGELVGFIKALINEKNVDRHTIINACKVRHQIMVSRSMDEAHGGGKMECEQSFDALFNREAHVWFDCYCTHEVTPPLTRKVRDTTLAGYHWSNADGTVTAELR